MIEAVAVLALKGDFAEASGHHYHLLSTIRLLCAEGNPGGVKCALKLLGLCGDHVRLPLANVSAKTEAALKSVISATLTVS